MEEAVQMLIDHTKTICGLDAYILKTHHIFHDVQAGYIFCSEWTPKDTLAQEDKDSNPPGTAIIEINFHTKVLKSIVFTDALSFIEEGSLPSRDRDQLLDWIEEQTDMTYGRQFKLIHEKPDSLEFQASIDNMPVAPSGSIRIKFNDAGQLILFSVQGVFPDESEMEWEPFSLTPEDTAPITRGLLTLLDVPVEKELTWVPFYKINPVFVTNDGANAISASAVNEHPVYFEKDILLEWSGEASGSVEKRKITLDDSVALSDALQAAPHYDQLPISHDMEQTCIEEIRRVMQLEYPAGSGKWKITSMYRQHGSIIAIVHHANNHSAVPAKVKILLDDTGKAFNVIDNKFLFQLIAHFKHADQPKLTADEAFSKLQEHIITEPVYAFNRETGKYHIHGKIDCPFAVNALTGELVKTKDIL